MTGTQQYERDVHPTSQGDLAITFLGHGSLRLDFRGKIIQVDPFGKVADYRNQPKADLILLTHEHFDHLDTQALAAICTERTQVVLTQACAAQGIEGIVLHNGDSKTVLGIRIEAVPAYNLVHKRPDGQPFHPKGSGNGYLLTFGATRLYLAGDTENIPEMKNLKDVTIAFLPMNLPYTMTPEMAADAALMIRPRILYPYHYSDTDPSKLVALLKDEKGIEVRIRRLS
jgi:L-ascorbate metabolism protein UlaG (beta-lactamase superfamily)